MFDNNKCATSPNWADMEEEEDEKRSLSSSSPLVVAKLSYVSVVSKGISYSTGSYSTGSYSGSYSAGSYPPISDLSLEDSDPDPDCSCDFIAIKKKRDICEKAVLQWAKNKNGVIGEVVEIRYDEEIFCIRCAIPFIFTAKSKEKYDEKGWKMPKICKVCSQSRFKERKAGI